MSLTLMNINAVIYFPFFWHQCVTNYLRYLINSIVTRTGLSYASSSGESVRHNIEINPPSRAPSRVGELLILI